MIMTWHYSHWGYNIYMQFDSPIDCLSPKDHIRLGFPVWPNIHEYVGYSLIAIVVESCRQIMKLQLFAIKCLGIIFKYSDKVNAPTLPFTPCQR